MPCWRVPGVWLPGVGVNAVLGKGGKLGLFWFRSRSTSMRMACSSGVIWTSGGQLRKEPGCDAVAPGVTVTPPGTVAPTPELMGVETSPGVGLAW